MTRFPLLFLSLTAMALSHLALAEDLVPLPEDDPDGKALIAEAQKIVAAYHGRGIRLKAKIRLVYFHPSDREPLDDWEARMQRTIADVNAFYRDGLARLGVETKGLPFERKRGMYRFYVVKGKRPASAYSYESGDVIAGELRQALKGKIDFSMEHVLVIHGLCHEEPDGKFVFNAPYYGGGNQRRGICHAADCRLLDPRLLGETNKNIVYAEHYYERQEQTLALFNSWYLGGIAHELGHGIGLPHNNGTLEESDWSAVSLMGVGNHHYRSEVWGGETPAFLSRSCALRLLSSPLISGSGKKRSKQPSVVLEGVVLKDEDGEFSLGGNVESPIAVYAAIAYIWPYRSYPDDPGTDHWAVTFPTIVKAGRFDFAEIAPAQGDYHMKISFVHCNGASSELMFHLSIGDDGTPSLEQVKNGGS